MANWKARMALGATSCLALVAIGCGGAGKEAAPPAQQASIPTPTPAVAAPPPARPKGIIEPAADDLLRRMSDQIGNARAFRLKTAETHDRIGADGAKTVMTFERDLVLERPNHIWLHATGKDVDAEGWYDGREFTVRQAAKKLYAQAVVPPDIDGFLDYVATRIEVRMPMADLFYDSPYQSYVGPETSGRVVGDEDVDGVKTTHLAFTDPVLDFDVWIDSGDKPVPKRLRISYKSSPGAPVSDMTFKSWDLEPKVDPATFAFEPRKDDVRIRFAGQARPSPEQG